MGEFRDELQDILDRVDALDALDVFLIAFLIYMAFLLLRGTAAITLLRGAAIILLGAVILAQALELEVLDFVIRNSLAGLIIAVPIIFQPEIRRALERVGRTGLRMWGRPSYHALIDMVTTSAMELAKQRHGALIVFERETGLQSYVETGIPLDAAPSVELLEGIFYPNAPMHDGAVIMRDNRVAAAGCTLPLSETRLPGEMGLRHRAGLGVTEGTDAVSLMVSEETGMVAVAADGRIYSRLDETRLRGLLHRLLDSTAQPDAAKE
ncbi:MAG: TIGR00159 family protein [Chloroflexi bacterium RBG_16_68_14]|nr:MAG: TIGR00159 family protein [Chloroflexi bacterium RBG_16_68_14]